MTDQRDFSRRSVLTDLLGNRPTSRKAISERTGLSAATVSRAVDALVADGVIREEAEIISENRGRRAVRLDVVAERCTVLGVDLGASNTRMILADFAGESLARVELPTPSGLAPAELAHWLVGVADRLASGRDDVAAVSVGLPGAVAETRTVSNAPNLDQVEDPAFRDALDQGFSLPVSLDNDVNYALLGEQRSGSAMRTPSAAMVTIGAGLGAALAIDGRIIHGRHGLVGEFGQLPVGPFGARLEHMVTGPGILRRAEEAGHPLSRPEGLFGSDPALAGLRAQFDHALQIVLTAIAVSSEPEVIVLGGGIASSLAPDLGRYQAALEANLRIAPRLVMAGLADFSGAVGAVIASLQTLDRGLGVEPADLARTR
jgi:predicted NBD/HSP70 family sugar kinase/biotin operon repressor